MIMMPVLFDDAVFDVSVVRSNAGFAAEGDTSIALVAVSIESCTIHLVSPKQFCPIIPKRHETVLQDAKRLGLFLGLFLLGGSTKVEGATFTFVWNAHIISIFELN